jgi:hypothetical protein
MKIHQRSFITSFNLTTNYRMLWVWNYSASWFGNRIISANTTVLENKVIYQNKSWKTSAKI